jgi:hypothetical protein
MTAIATSSSHRPETAARARHVALNDVQQNSQSHPSTFAVADHSIDGVDRLLPDNTHSSDHPKLPAARLQQLTARTESS